MKRKILLLVVVVGLISSSVALVSKRVVFAEWGDFILNSKSESMKKAKVNPVLFPHWFHRIRFKCKVCHEKIFIMRNGGNDINMADIINRKFCGRCHDGTLAFSPKDCARCHSYNEEKFTVARVVQADKREYAEKYMAYRKKYVSEKDGTVRDGKSFPYVPMMKGLDFDKEAFKDLEKDKYGLVNWVKAVTQGKISPLSQIGQEKIEDTMIIKDNLIVAKSDVVNDILFPHSTHTFWLNCEVCHDGIFPRDKEYEMYMKDISKGKFCGRCHGKVAFPLGDCFRCHTIPKERF